MLQIQADQLVFPTIFERRDMENNYIRRNQNQGVAEYSPRLLRSKSGAPNMSANPLSSSPRKAPPLTPNSLIHRSKSTTRSRVLNKEEENLIGVFIRSNRKQIAVKAVDGINASNRMRSAPTSPSAWALSPGRSPIVGVKSRSSNNGGKTNSLIVEAKVRSNSGGGKMKSSSGGVSGVLKYFRTKKVCTVEEEAFHRHRVLYTRLLQWRVVNARAETTTAKRNSIAQETLFNVWLRNFQMRNSVVEKRVQLQKVRHETKLLQIINPELHLLNEWTRIENRNAEVMKKLGRNLSTLSIRLPLVKGAKGEMISVYKAMCATMDVMPSIEETIAKVFFKMEETCLMLKDVAITIRREREGLDELQKIIIMIASLKVQEESLRAHLIQASNGSSFC